MDGNARELLDRVCDAVFSRCVQDVHFFSHRENRYLVELLRSFQEVRLGGTTHLYQPPVTWKLRTTPRRVVEPARQVVGCGVRDGLGRVDCAADDDW